MIKKTDKLAIIYGSEPSQMVSQLLDEMDLINAIPKKSTVRIKPNLVVSKPSESGATTDPEVVGEIIIYLKEHGISDIEILESSWIGDNTEQAFEVCGYKALAKELKVRLINLEAAESSLCKIGNLSFRVFKQALGPGFLINVPKLKAHCQTKITCSLKNLKGLIPHSEKRRFHTLGLDKPIAYLAAFLKPNFTVVDCITSDLSYEEGGNPVSMNRLIAGYDPVLTDSYGASLLGYEPKEIEHIRLAAELGIGCMNYADAHIFELNRPVPNNISVQVGRQAQQYLKYIEQNNACSACTSSLIHGLKRAEKHFNLNKISGKIHIGQGYRDQKASGIGIGTCTKGFENHLKGCPPSALKIKEYLIDQYRQ